MPLQWARLDCNIGSHDKILALLSDPSPKKWQAFASYMTSIAWSVGQGTDGRIAHVALPFVHGTTTTARLLVKYRLWAEETAAWRIINFEQRQQASATSEVIAEERRKAGTKGNCKRWHGDTCWRNGECSRAIA